MAARWEPVPLGAEFSPQMEKLLSPDKKDGLLTGVKARSVASDVLRTKVRRHLLALGWSIFSRSYPNAPSRLRYLHPHAAKPCYTLLAAIDAAANAHTATGAIVQYTPPDQRHPIAMYDPAIGIAHSPPDDDGEDEHEEENVVAEYVKLVVSKARGQGARAKRLLGEAKDKLLSSGWTSSVSTRKNGRQDIRFRGPNGGRSYTSVVTACQAYLAMATTKPKPASPAADATPPRLMIAGVVGDSGNESSAVIDPPTSAGGGGSCNSKYKRKRSMISTFFSDHDAEDLKGSCPDKKKKKKMVKKKKACARVLKPKDGERQPLLPSASPQQRHARTLLSVLNDRNFLARRERLSYRPATPTHGRATKEGVLAGDGSLIRCMCGCKKAPFTVAEFVAHAGGSGDDDRPLSRLFLKDGRSLSRCLLEVMAEDGRGTPPLRPRLKGRCSHENDDSVCSVCHEYGELLLCDHCPSTFHHACVGLDATPQGDWFCPSCTCCVCRSSDFDPADATRARLTDKTIIYCDQCEREHHVGCIRGRGIELDCYPKGPWLCSTNCSEIFELLQGLVGTSVATSVEGLSFTVLRSASGGGDEEAMAEQHGKLRVAFDILHECFVTLMEPRTNSDLTEDIVFNREAELRRINFRGFYMIGIEKGGELITVGTLRVYGNKVAELPLVGTRFVHRRKGMCRLLMNQLEKLLEQLGVERLVLPAVPELLETWTASFGFQVMGRADRLEIAEHTILSFRGTTMCHKFIATSFTDVTMATSFHHLRLH